MSDLNLRFLPWLRRGLARSIAANTTDSSATIAFSLTVGGSPVNQSLRMRGPGDVVGIDPAQIIRVEPRPGTVDFEPNYFPAVEFATPDLPWMFTPTAPDADNHLLPWLTLITVSEAAVVIETRPNVPLPVLTVDVAELPPDLNEMWAWAHVQTTSIYETGELTQALIDTPAAFISRILSPRNLKANTNYSALLVPTFKAGVRAGLGQPPDDTVGQTLAWNAGDSGEIELPVYYSWSFRTSSTGDFEALVTRLQPTELDETVGRRDMDIRDIGIPLPKTSPDTTYFFGALVSPTAMSDLEPGPKPPIFPSTQPELPPPPIDLPRSEADPIRQTLYEFLTPEVSEPGDGPYDYRVDDPVMTPAIYGREQLKGAPLPPPNSIIPKLEQPVWYSVVNTLPRTRGAAGLGVRIVRRHQEDFMARAWSEVTSLRAINQTLQQAAYAALIASRWQSRVALLEDGTALQLTRSAHARILPASGKTIWGRVRAASLPSGIISMSFQRMVRSGGVVHHALRLATGSPVSQPEIHRIAVTDPARLLSLSAHTLPLGAQVLVIPETDSSPGWYAEPISGAIAQIRNRLDAVLAGGISTAERPEIADAALTANRLAANHIAYLDGLAGRGYMLTSEMQATRSAASTLVSTTSKYANHLNAGKTPTLAQVKSIRSQAQTLHDSLTDWTKAGAGIIITPNNPVAKPTDTLQPIAAALQASLNPTQTISAYLQSRISVNSGTWGTRPIPSRFTAAPVFEDALYRYVCELSPEYMLPGIGEIPQNTVGLVEVNGEFVEAVLIGANHEMSREMRWREYPADLSSTWFKRFWNAAQDDIDNIGGPHWLGKNTLGENLIGQLSDDALVLLVKGEVLRRYPNLAVYALPATVTEMRDENNRKQRVRVPKEPEQPQYPVFSGRLDNGVRFFGFDNLTTAKALGTATPTNTSTDGGYFFALQEQPSEPRFGLNEYQSGVNYKPKNLDYWSDLSWGHFMKGNDPDSPTYLSISGKFDGTRLPDSTEPDAKTSTWGSHAGAMARIVLQRPVRMLVHASMMLP